MEKKVSRTFATSLTDDEIILLDVMFSGGAPFRLLRRENLNSQWNRRSHNLTDEQLRDTLQRFVKSGVMSLGARWQSGGDSGSGEHFYEAWE